MYLDTESEYPRSQKNTCHSLLYHGDPNMVTAIFFTISENMHEGEKSTKDLVAKCLFLDYILNVEFIFLK